MDLKKKIDLVFVPHNGDKRRVFLNSITSFDTCITWWSLGLFKYMYSLILAKVHLFALNIVIDTIFIDLRGSKSYIDHDRTPFTSRKTQIVRICLVRS